MKPVAFDYARARTLDEAVSLLASAPHAKILAGGQTLGPMLNLRLAQPGLIVDITRIAELVRQEADEAGVTLGACVTHADIEDGRVGDPSNGLMRRVARGIAYRAVRNRGTIGGSLAHCDPAADWVSTFCALDAEVLITGANGTRNCRVRDFAKGAMVTDLAPDEVLHGIYIPRPVENARTGFHKICRKTGEFADAIGVVVENPAHQTWRAVVGATQSRPIVIDDAARLAPLNGSVDRRAVREVVLSKGGAALARDTYHLNILTVALERAFGEAFSNGSPT